jgi:hypothetical protein
MELARRHTTARSARLARTTGWGEAERHRLSRQIARYGELAGRDLAAQASASRAAKDVRKPGRHGAAWNCRPLSAEEQLELQRLARSIARSRVSSGKAGSQRGGW